MPNKTPKYISMADGWIIASANFTHDELKARFSDHHIINHGLIEAKVGQHALTCFHGSTEIKPVGKAFDPRIINNDLGLA